MELPLKAAYLDIDWQGRGCARTVKVAPEPIEIEQLPDGTWTAETEVFNGLCPWVGLRPQGELSDAQPAFEDPEGNLKPMLRIEDGHGGHWWVQDDGWDREGKRHLSELHRSMGQFTVVIGLHRLVLNNVVDGLGRADVEDYLRHFQDDLIWLVMGFGGATANTGGGAMANQEMVQALDSFAAAARRVLTHPAQHVREIQAEDRLARLRPNGATFRQYLRNPTAQRLTGRAAEETPNIAENRYLRHMVQVCEKLATHAVKAAGRYAQSYTERARIESERSVSCNEMTYRQVDPQVFDRQMDELQRKLDRVSQFRFEGNELGKQASNWEFRPNGMYGNLPNQMFYSRKDGSAASDDNLGVKFSVLQVPKQLADAIQVTKSFCDYYSLDGIAHAKIEYSKNDKQYRKVHFTSVHNARPFTGALDRKTIKRDQLEKNGWLAPLSAKERQEMRQEAVTARSRERVYAEYAQRAQQAFAALGQCQAELRSQDVSWEGLQVPPSPVVPMGVRFSQSPDYAACLAAFSKVTAHANGSGLPVAALDAIERMGVLHASALYEHWCLIQIISILVEDYRFDPEDGWQERLLRAVTGTQQSVTLTFHRSDLGWVACLESQPELANGRRPDFRLRFLRNAPVRSCDQGGGAPWDKRHQYDDHNHTARYGLVMDAKFRTKWRHGELGRTLASLVEEKDYGQEGDRVFILHPAPNSILRPTSPLEWGQHCDYGQDRENAHRKGVVYLSPAVGNLNLRRLIVMLLQTTFPKPFREVGENSRIHPGNSFCIRCGCPHRHSDIKQQITRKGNIFWTFECVECGMHVTRTHCFGCDEGVLFKNGLQLTYHRTVADQVTNVVCPHCGTYFDSDVHGSRAKPHDVNPVVSSGCS